MKKGTGLPTAPGSIVEDEKRGGVSDRTGSDASVSLATGCRLEEEVDPISSSSFSSSVKPPGELGGFTSASQVYSVRHHYQHHHHRHPHWKLSDRTMRHHRPVISSGSCVSR